VSWEAKLRAISLDHLYMIDDVPREIPSHELWQAPFVFAPRDESWDQLQARVRRAGELWLINQDMRTGNELVIAHVERPWFMAFQRGLRPDEGNIWIGPFDLRVLKPADGHRLWDLPLCYRETEHATSRELWRRIARADQ
jgi:hypothetical protein